MAHVTLDNVVKTYPNGHQAVRGVSLLVIEGEFLVLVGPSGCGKSTLLRMIAGLEEISSGKIAIGERIVNDTPARDRNIAMVFQNYALYPHMTVRKNMGFALSLRGTPKDEVDRRVREAATMLGIENLLDRKPGQLSGGQRQRVAVGRAIVRNPQVALFDEPLSNLDAKLRVATRAELKGLHQRLKTTSIYVTHDQEEAMTLGDRIVVMSHGVIQQVGTPLEVYRKPANRFVAAFVGMPPMNFIEGTLDADASRFTPDGGLAPIALPGDAKHLRAHAGKKLAMGFRPQSVRLGGTGDWPARVEIAEPLGDLMDVSLAVGAVGATPAKRVVARMAIAEEIRPGFSGFVSIAPQDVHWFEAGEFGVRVP